MLLISLLITTVTDIALNLSLEFYLCGFCLCTSKGTTFFHVLFSFCALRVPFLIPLCVSDSSSLRDERGTEEEEADEGALQAGGEHRQCHGDLEHRGSAQLGEHVSTNTNSQPASLSG